LELATMTGAQLAGADLRGAHLAGIDLAHLDWHRVRIDVAQALLLATALGAHIE